MATICGTNKIDSNITGLAFAEEECLKQLQEPTTWHGLEPNSYSDFGGELSTVARSPIDPSRQNKKGAVTDLDASGGFNIDFTKSNLTRLLQGFFFADAREMPSTQPLNGTQVSLSSVDSAGKKYIATAGLNIFKTGQLVYATGFANSANNGLKTVVSAGATSLEVAEPLVNEVTTQNAKLEAVGMSFEAGDLNLAVVSGLPSIISATVDFTKVPSLIAGAWVFIGGDGANSYFSKNKGYARIKAVTQSALTFDDTTFTASDESGAGKSIQLFIGTTVRNEKLPELIKRRSYNIERQLGMGANSTQAEYLEGAVANEFTLNIPQADKLNADLSFIACDNTHRSGDVGDEIKIGKRIPAMGEDAYNTSSDIYRIKMSINSSVTSSPSDLFGYVSDGKITINNNVTPTKAIGTLGAFDTTAGNFEVGGSLTAYFTTIEAVRAVRQNADVGLSVIGASKNAGFVFDIPLLGLGGGRLNVEKDSPITVPLEPSGAENENGYTLHHQSFSYLPNSAMPT